MRRRRSALAAIATLATVVLGAPAVQAAPAPDAVTGECAVQMIPSGSLDPEFSIVGHATAVTTKEVVVATGVSCEVHDANTGAVYGRTSRYMSGPASATAGTARLPLSSNLFVRWCGTVLYASGRTETICDPN